MMEYPYNLIVIQQTGDALLDSLLKALESPPMGTRCLAGGHFTNGTYVGDPEEVVPTTLAQFQYVLEKKDNGNKDTALIIAINSRTSLRENAKLLDKAGETEKAERMRAEIDHTLRAEKVGIPLALQRPDETVIVVFYDEPTPAELYKMLSDAQIGENKLGMRTLFKWGYGTKRNAPIIIGAEHFDDVIAAPLPNDKKPICVGLTPTEAQKGKIDVVDLRKEIGSNGKPYITAINECLFTLVDPNVRVYGPKERKGRTRTPKAPSPA